MNIIVWKRRVFENFLGYQLRHGDRVLCVVKNSLGAWDRAAVDISFVNEKWIRMRVVVNSRTQNRVDRVR